MTSSGELTGITQVSGGEVELDFPSPGYYLLTMTVSDGANTNTTSVTIGVLENFPPVALISRKNGSTLDDINGGTIYTDGSITLTAVNSYDVDSRYGDLGPQSLDYRWYLEGGTIVSGANLQTHIPLGGTYLLELVVGDGSSYSRTSITVVVIARDVIISMGFFLLFLIGRPPEVKPSMLSKATTVFQVLTVAFILWGVSKGGHRLLIHFLIYATSILTILSGAHYIFIGFKLISSEKIDNDGKAV
jgi:hypothetical protein